MYLGSVALEKYFTAFLPRKTSAPINSIAARMKTRAIKTGDLDMEA
jgi:hypothetical protein